MNSDLKKLLDEVDVAYAEFKRRAQKAVDEKDWTHGALKDTDSSISTLNAKYASFKMASCLTAKP